MNRLLLVGIDSADADLIERWTEEGHLPTLRELRRGGVWARLGTTAEVMHVSAWPSIYTGTTPGEHGLYHAFQISPGEQALHRTRPEECARPPFWRFLDGAGRRCVVMDAFLTYPLADFHGTQILEYGTWTWFSTPMAAPAGLWKEIARRFGPYPAPDHARVPTRPEPRQFHRQLLAGVRHKAQVVRWLMSARPWDLFFVTFGETHAAGHYLWHLQDSAYPAHPDPVPAGLGNALRDVYGAVDEALGYILGAADDTDTVLVVSGDGMGPNYSGTHLLPEVLARLGLYRGADVARRDHTDGAALAAGRNRSTVSVLRELMPIGVRRALSRCLPRHVQSRLSMKWVSENVDWAATKAFCIPKGNEGYIRLNLEAREPKGTVARGSASAELVAELRARIEEIVNPANGRRAASRVVPVDDVFPGDRRDHLPDLVVTWDPEARVLGQLHSDRCGLVKGPAAYQVDPCYTGNHRPSAFVVGRGPTIARGARLADAHIIDIAPTALAMLGVDPPREMRGRVWNELIGASVTAS